MRLRTSSTHHPTCPLCRESVFLLETRSCEGCRTHYHQACLEEFTGCSTLGCASTTYVEAELVSARLTPGSDPMIRVSERPATPSPLQVWALRSWAGLRGVWTRSGELGALRERVRLIDGVAVGLLVSVAVLMVLVVCHGLSTLVQIDRTEVAAILLALLALSGVVFAAHAVSSRSE